LTDLGRKQASLAGDYIRKYISKKFDRYYCSEYIRYRRPWAGPRTGIALYGLTAQLVWSVGVQGDGNGFAPWPRRSTVVLRLLSARAGQGRASPVSPLTLTHTHTHTHNDRTHALIAFSFLISCCCCCCLSCSQLLGGVSDLQRKEEEHYRNVMAQQERGTSSCPPPLYLTHACRVLFAPRAVPHTHRWIPHRRLLLGAAGRRVHCQLVLACGPHARYSTVGSPACRVCASRHTGPHQVSSVQDVVLRLQGRHGVPR
jgi:hypothetical protein